MGEADRQTSFLRMGLQALACLPIPPVLRQASNLTRIVLGLQKHRCSARSCMLEHVDCLQKCHLQYNLCLPCRPMPACSDEKWNAAIACKLICCLDHAHVWPCMAAALLLVQPTDHRSQAACTTACLIFAVASGALPRSSRCAQCKLSTAVESPITDFCICHGQCRSQSVVSAAGRLLQRWGITPAAAPAQSLAINPAQQPARGPAAMLPPPTSTAATGAAAAAAGVAAGRAAAAEGAVPVGQGRSAQAPSHVFPRGWQSKA